MGTKRAHPWLASARAYWRLAAKSRRAGNYREGDHWQGVADRLYSRYQREVRRGVQ